MKRACFVYFWIIAVLLTGLSAFSDEGEVSKDSAPKQERSASNIFIPFVNYSPETRLSYGVTDIFYFYLDDTPRPSSFRILAMGTENKQAIFRTQPEFFFSSNQYRLVADIAYYDYPDRFYGFGNSTLNSDQELFTNQFFRIFVNFRKRISGPLELGPLYEFENDRISFDPSMPLLSSGQVTGASGGVISGVGLIASWDTRDRIFYPSNGSFHQASYAVFSPLFGSHFSYQRFRLDLRNFWTLFDEHILAFNFIVQLMDGRPAMYQTSPLGGDRMMRGYWEGRYRDLHLIASQIEYRLPIFWRFGGAGFLGAGNVSRSLENLVTTGFKPSYGVGLRFAFDQTQKVNGRLDIAWGENTSGFYLQLGEAF